MRKETQTERVNGAVVSNEVVTKQDNRRYFIVIFKLVLFTVINIVLGIAGAEIIKLFVLPYIEQYGKLSLAKLLLNNVNGFRDSTYAKYCYVVIGLWVYVFLSEIWLIFRSIKKIDCIKNDECLSCEKYLKCRYRDIKIERNY